LQIANEHVKPHQQAAKQASEQARRENGIRSLRIPNAVHLQFSYLERNFIFSRRRRRRSYKNK